MMKGMNEMDIDSINKNAEMRGKEVEELNRKLKDDLEITGGIELLTKYVMSETIAPIEDYENVVNIVKANLHRQPSSELLIIGAYLAIQWTYSKNELLENLNLNYDSMPDKEKAIVNYLNAYQMYIRDEGYLSKLDYRQELEKSISFNITFVNNFYRLAEISNENEARRYYDSALTNVIKVLDEEEIAELTINDFLNPDFFISEHILGTNVSYANYKILCEKAKVL